MNIQEFLYAVEVAKSGSFTRAAARLYVTEPTVSQQIRRLEKELGVKLFTRSTRSVSVTEAGKLFLKDAVPLTAHYQNIMENMSRITRDNITSLSIGMTPAMNVFDIQYLIKKFTASHENILVYFDYMTDKRLYTALLEGTLDFAILKLTPGLQSYFSDTQFKKILLKEEIFQIIVDESLIAEPKESFTLKDLENIPAVLDGIDTFMEKELRQLYQEENIRPLFAPVRSNDLRHLFDSVKRKEGYLLASTSLADWFKEQHPFFAAPLVPEYHNDIFLIYQKNLELGKVDRAFIADIKKWIEMDV